MFALHKIKMRAFVKCIKPAYLQACSRRLEIATSFLAKCAADIFFCQRFPEWKVLKCFLSDVFKSIYGFRDAC